MIFFTKCISALRRMHGQYMSSAARHSTSSFVKKRGFTLLELMVAITISGVIMTAIMSSYASLIRTKQKVDQHRQIQAQATLALSRIADKVRDYGIDYDAHDPTDPNTLFVGTDVNGEDVVFTFTETDEGQFTLQQTTGGRVSPLFSRGVTATGSFTVSPDAIGRPALYQPKVHVQLAVSSAKDETIKMDLQTTLSSRRYR